ncbi:hypothetical protein N8I84_01695 [Streptomyces cynarae]|uniref:Uncharacterized protein n=1 Tax=Streptomyces cynarae TaxID=2981134 RepID=A0ABY6DTQ5_9ACTN|nr:hypothetical protein [Streptomyces cynarae]UXY17613.1 hypothetical protein N8I84_01695 [Streptomyces cynarae]
MERIDQLLADAAPGTVYDPDTDDVIRAELAAEAAAAAQEAELREAARIAARADELQALRELGTLEQTGPREGDEAARDELTRRAGGYVQADVDAWLAYALAARIGHYADPAAGPPPVSCRSPSSPSSRCSPNSPAWSRPLLSTRWRSGPGSPPPTPRPPPASLRSSPAPPSRPTPQGARHDPRPGTRGGRRLARVQPHRPPLRGPARRRHPCAWTEPPLGETYYPDEDDPDYNSICHCPRTPRVFCMECAGYADCEQCRCPSPAFL